MIREISDQSAWNSFLLELNPNTFLQSWEWGQVQKEDGKDVRYLGIFENNEQIGACLLLTINARRGRHFLIPHGPVFKTEKLVREHLPEIIEYCKSLAISPASVTEGDSPGVVAGLRIAPLLESTTENISTFQNLGFRPAPLHVHAELTWVLDIDNPVPVILAGMRKTTRHAIRKAEQAGIAIGLTTKASALERFMPLYQQTKQRHAFVPYSRRLLTKQLKHMTAFAIFASHAGADLAAAICFQFGSTIFYFHGASVPSKIPAAQLLQWHAIQEAKRRGATRYNFWGITKQANHPFSGITTFKKGFGGYAIDYLHAQDLPLSPGYWKLWAVDTYRKFRRGF